MHFLSIHNLNGHDVSQWYVELQSTSTYDNLRKPTSIRNLFMHMILTQTYVMRELFFGIRVLDQVWQSSTYGINSMSLTSVSGYHSVTSSRDSLGGWEGGGGAMLYIARPNVRRYYWSQKLNHLLRVRTKHNNNVSRCRQVVVAINLTPYWIFRGPCGGMTENELLKLFAWRWFSLHAHHFFAAIDRMTGIALLDRAFNLVFRPHLVF